MINSLKLICLIAIMVTHSSGMQIQVGSLQQTIYTFLKGMPSAQKVKFLLFLNFYYFLMNLNLSFKFFELLGQTANFAKDKSVINALNVNTQKLTVFVPTNEAILQLSSQQQTQNPEILRNNLHNLIIKRKNIDLFEIHD